MDVISKQVSFSSKTWFCGFPPLTGFYSSPRNYKLGNRCSISLTVLGQFSASIGKFIKCCFITKKLQSVNQQCSKGLMLNELLNSNGFIKNMQKFKSWMLIKIKKKWVLPFIWRPICNMTFLALNPCLMFFFLWHNVLICLTQIS